MLRIDRTARAPVDAPVERCLAVLGDVERYPEWARLVDSVERDGDRVRLRVSVLGLSVAMDCVLSVSDDGAVLRKLPNDADDEERYEATWKISPDGFVSLHVEAALDAPGPARLISGRVGKALVDDLLDDFRRAVQS